MCISKEVQVEDVVFEWIQVVFENGGVVCSVDLNDEEVVMIKFLGFLIVKLIIYVINVSEDDLVEGNIFCIEVVELVVKEGVEMVWIFVQVEVELVELGDEEIVDYLEGFGVMEGGL